MISESQARTLLQECEDALGRELTTLRAQLANSHNTLGALWELITLHTSIQLGEGVDHEPEPARPDVLIDLLAVERFWIEATHIEWPERDASDMIAKFIDWVRLELKDKRGIDPRLYYIRIDAVTTNSNAVIPPEHVWASLRRSDEWHRLATVVQSETGKIVVDLPDPFSARVTIDLHATPQAYLTSGYTSPQLIEKISDHPIWKALRSKADQARSWKLPDPVVVCICSSRTVSLFDSLQGFSPDVQAAVCGALYDTSKWHVIHQHNLLRDTSGDSYKVRGADRISAVILVSIEEKNELNLYRKNHNRIARIQFIVNEQARHPLSTDQLRALKSLNFNAFPYGPQWELWPEPTRREWKNPERIVKRSDPGKVVVFAPRSDGTFDLQIPLEDLTKVLAGVESADGLRESIQGVRANLMLAKLPPIVAAQVIPANPREREAARLKLTFGAPEPMVVQGLRSGK